MKRSPHYGYWILAMSVALLLIGIVLAPHDSQAARPLSPEQTVQTTYPAPALVNVGRSSRQDTLHIEGQTNLPARTLQMTLWKDGGSLLNPSDGVEMRIVGDQAYGRSVGSEWQEIDDFSGTFAPADFDTGPFRWLVHLGVEGKLLATSAAFYLPRSNGAVAWVEASLESP